MFGWLRPRPPLGGREKAWAETRLQRLLELLGAEQLQCVKMVLPTDESSAQHENDGRVEAAALSAQIRAVSRLASTSPNCRSTRGLPRRLVNQSVRRARKGRP